MTSRPTQQELIDFITKHTKLPSLDIKPESVRPPTDVGPSTNAVIVTIPTDLYFNKFMDEVASFISSLKSLSYDKDWHSKMDKGFSVRKDVYSKGQYRVTFDPSKLDPLPTTVGRLERGPRDYALELQLNFPSTLAVYDLIQKAIPGNWKYDTAQQYKGGGSEAVLTLPTENADQVKALILPKLKKMGIEPEQSHNNNQIIIDLDKLVTEAQADTNLRGSALRNLILVSQTIRR